MNSKSFLFETGLEVEDKITGFVGIITGRADYISGCNQYMVQPVTEDGKYAEPHWFDELRLRHYGSAATALIDERKQRTGADGQAPKK